MRAVPNGEPHGPFQGPWDSTASFENPESPISVYASPSRSGGRSQPFALAARTIRSGAEIFVGPEIEAALGTAAKERLLRLGALDTFEVGANHSPWEGPEIHDLEVGFKSTGRDVRVES